MKKLISIVLILAMVLSLAACKSNNGKQPVEPDGTPTAALTDTPEVPTKEPVTDGGDASASAGDFTTADRAFCRDDSTELFNICLGVFPVNDTVAVLQFAFYDATDDVEIPVEKYYAFTCTLNDKAAYRSDEAGIAAVIDKDGNVTVSADDAKYKDIEGRYYGAGDPGMPNCNTIVEYLRNIPAAGIGDFGKGEDDEVEESITGAWFHDVMLFRNGELFKNFLATDDMTGFCEVKGETCELIYGNMDSTLEQINYPDFELDEDEEYDDLGEYEYFEMPVVYPYVFGGNELEVGATSFVDLSTPYGLPFILTVSSADESIVSVNETVITAMAEGETELHVSVDYAGSKKEYVIPVVTAIYDNEMISIIAEYDDPSTTSWFDVISQRATMRLKIEDDLYNGDIYWADSADTLHHWSFIGMPDPDDEFLVNLSGWYAIENYDSEGNCTVLEYEDDVYTTLTYEDTGFLRWYDIERDYRMFLFESTSMYEDENAIHLGMYHNKDGWYDLEICEGNVYKMYGSPEYTDEVIVINQGYLVKTDDMGHYMAYSTEYDEIPYEIFEFDTGILNWDGEMFYLDE